MIDLNNIQKIVFIGAGNLATHLSLALKGAGFPVVQVYSRTETSVRTLAEKLRADYTCRIEEVIPDADIYFVALSDRAMIPVLEQLNIEKGILLHTAGSIPMDSLKPFAREYGVFYPLQTFSREREVDFEEIPICVEASIPELKELLMEMGRRISQNVQEVSSEQRRQLHLAAVFTCNFTNHMYSIGQELLNQKGLDFDLLRPLIRETAAKVQELDPQQAQTGPAIRFDEEVMKKHEEELNATPMFQKLYRFVSESIHNMHSMVKKASHEK